MRRLQDPLLSRVLSLASAACLASLPGRYCTVYWLAERNKQYEHVATVYSESECGVVIFDCRLVHTDTVGYEQAKTKSLPLNCNGATAVALLASSGSISRATVVTRFLILSFFILTAGFTAMASSSSSEFASGTGGCGLDSSAPSTSPSLKRDLEAEMTAATDTDTTVSSEAPHEPTRTDSSAASIAKRVRLSIPGGAPTEAATGDDCALDKTPKPRVGNCNTSCAVTPCGASTTTTTTTTAGGALTPSEITDLLWTEARYNKTQDSVGKRPECLGWDDCFLSVAALSALRSKDPHNASGACLVDEQNRVIGIGYNGFPSGCPDDCLPWAATTSNDGAGEAPPSDTIDSKKKKWLHTKEPFVVHAKVNAILNKCASDVAGARLYSRTFPCHECAKVIVQSRIREVVYTEPPDDGSDSARAARIMLTMGGVQLRLCEPTRSTVEIKFALPTETAAPRDEHRNGGGMTENDSQELPQLGGEKLQESSALANKYRELLLQEADYDPLAVPADAKKRQAGVLSWDDYFMAMTHLTALRSKDPNTQVGACIVSRNKRIVGLGYNGFPVGCTDEALPWARKAESPLHTKYPYVCHAEVNAILNKGAANVGGATLYVGLFPCNECAKMIVQARIAEVVYMNDSYRHDDKWRASRILLQMAGVKLRQYTPTRDTVVLNLLQKDGGDSIKKDE